MLRRGFTLVEVLVTLVILLFGLLGIAGLMAKGQRASFEAFQRQEALSLASDMAERIRANPSRTSVLAYIAGAPVIAPLGGGVNYGQLLQGVIPNCGTTNTCAASDFVNYDLALWDGLLNGYSECTVGNCGSSAGNVGGIISAQGCIENTNLAAATTSCPAAPAPTGTTYTQPVRISVAWQGNDTTAPPPAAFTCGTGSYGTESQRRVVALDLILTEQCP